MNTSEFDNCRELCFNLKPRLGGLTPRQPLLVQVLIWLKNIILFHCFVLTNFTYHVKYHVKNNVMFSFIRPMLDFCISGIGYTILLVDIIYAIYGAILIAYCLHFIFASMTTELPWATCGHEWNTPLCSRGHTPSQQNLSLQSNNIMINRNWNCTSSNVFVHHIRIK